MQEIESSYHSENPYHNNIHAADVTQSLGCILIHDEFSSQLTDMELLSMIIAAAVHDVAHPGQKHGPPSNPNSVLLRLASYHHRLFPSMQTTINPITLCLVNAAAAVLFIRLLRLL